VYGVGPDEPSDLDWARADVLRGGVACGLLAGVLYRLDSVEVRERPRRPRVMPTSAAVVVEGIPCTPGLRTVVDLAALLD